MIILEGGQSRAGRYKSKKVDDFSLNSRIGFVYR